MTDYSTIVSAIADVGYWRWWTEHLPDLFQLEFGGAQIYSPPVTLSEAPSSLIALRFFRPSKISFLCRDSVDGLPADWAHLLQADKITPPTFSYDQFALNNDDRFKEVLSQVVSKVDHYSSAEGGNAVKLAFWAGSVGIRIEAADLRFVLMSGEVEISTVVSMHGAWWSYWNDYWAKRDTPEALPYDYSCEVTIPLKPE